MRREFAPLFLVALRASGGSGAHAAAARQLGLREIARLEQLAFTGEVRGEGEEMPPLPSVSSEERPHSVEGATGG